MVVHLTESIGTTHTIARVAAFLVNTGFGTLTVNIGDTLRLTGLVGVPNVVRNAGTHRSFACHAALRVCAARGRHARSDWRLRRNLPWLCGLRHRITAGVRVAYEARWAGADRSMFNNFTQRVNTTGPRTWIDAETVDAGCVAGAVIV